MTSAAGRSEKGPAQIQHGEFTPPPDTSKAGGRHITKGAVAGAGVAIVGLAFLILGAIGLAVRAHSPTGTGPYAGIGQGGEVAMTTAGGVGLLGGGIGAGVAYARSGGARQSLEGEDQHLVHAGDLPTTPSQEPQGGSISVDQMGNIVGVGAERPSVSAVAGEPTAIAMPPEAEAKQLNPDQFRGAQALTRLRGEQDGLRRLATQVTAQEPRVQEFLQGLERQYGTNLTKPEADPTLVVRTLKSPAAKQSLANVDLDPALEAWGNVARNEAAQVLARFEIEASPRDRADMMELLGNRRFRSGGQLASNTARILEIAAKYGEDMHTRFETYQSYLTQIPIPDLEFLEGNRGV